MVNLVSGRNICAQPPVAQMHQSNLQQFCFLARDRSDATLALYVLRAVGIKEGFASRRSSIKKEK